MLLGQPCAIFRKKAWNKLKDSEWKSWHESRGFKPMIIGSRPIDLIAWPPPISRCDRDKKPRDADESDFAWVTNNAKEGDSTPEDGKRRGGSYERRIADCSRRKLFHRHLLTSMIISHAQISTQRVNKTPCPTVSPKYKTIICFSRQGRLISSHKFLGCAGLWVLSFPKIHQQWSLLLVFHTPGELANILSYIVRHQVAIFAIHV